MGIFDIFKKEKRSNETSVGDVLINEETKGIHKAYIPEFLYKPPFGYPRKENIPLLRSLAKNGYVFSVIKTLCNEAAITDYDIVYKEDVEHTDELDKAREDILEFLDNPNHNKDNFEDIIKAVVKDIYELDSGVIVKVFNEAMEMVEIFARDGGSFLINPDIHGYIGNRAEYIEPIPANYLERPTGTPMYDQRLKQYSLAYKHKAAYFQYGTTAMALPVPFGRREIMYFKDNPQSNNVYGVSPVKILADIIMNLVYGSSYNLDFYMNNNMPEGIISVLGGNMDSIKAFKEQLNNKIKVEDKVTGFMRKVGFKIPVINQEAKFTPFQLDPKVMQILEQQEWFSKIVWSCFGVTPDELGFTEKSNKATGENQFAVYKRKAVKPVLKLIKQRLDKDLLPEFGEEVFRSLEFKWNDYNLDEDLKKHKLYQLQINMGLKTSEMVAEEEGIDIEKLKEQKEEQKEQEIEGQQAINGKFSIPKEDERIEENEELINSYYNNKNISLKHKYVRREGSPGNYNYIYNERKKPGKENNDSSDNKKGKISDISETDVTDAIKAEDGDVCLIGLNLGEKYGSNQKEHDDIWTAAQEVFNQDTMEGEDSYILKKDKIDEYAKELVEFIKKGKHKGLSTEDKSINKLKTSKDYDKSELEKELIQSIKKQGREIMNALDKYKKGQIDKIE